MDAKQHFHISAQSTHVVDYPPLVAYQSRATAEAEVARLLRYGLAFEAEVYCCPERGTACDVSDCCAD